NVGVLEVEQDLVIADPRDRRLRAGRRRRLLGQCVRARQQGRECERCRRATDGESGCAHRALARCRCRCAYWRLYTSVSLLPLRWISTCTLLVLPNCE